MNIAILASGNGTNFEAIAKAIKKGYLKVTLKVLITDKQNAYVRERARKSKIKEQFLNPASFQSRLDFDKALADILKKEKIDLIVLAGFMRILTPWFVKKFKNRILNIHPALLPAFKGEDAIARAYRYGSKTTGVTVHFIDEKVDNGPVILQEAVEIKEGMTLSQLEEKIHKIEHKLYPRVIKLYSAGKVKINRRHAQVI